jgi:mono/diheme cytochrome c family protein
MQFITALTSSASLALLITVLASSCTVTPRGASDPNLALAKTRSTDGASQYAANCGSCHGQRGEGVTAPPVIGLDSLPVFPRDPSQSTLAANTDANEQQMRQQLNPGGIPARPPFHTAQDVFQFVSEKMPPRRGASLSAEQYWGIINFILIADGTTVPTEGITPQNASKVTLRPR